MKKYTVYVAVESFDTPYEAEDFAKSQQSEARVWNNELSRDVYLLNDSVLFNASKKTQDEKRELTIYGYHHKIQANLLVITYDSKKERYQTKYHKRNFKFTKKYTTYTQLVNRAKKYFNFEES